MSTAVTAQVADSETRLRRFLIGLAAAICAITPVELLFSEHFKEVPQLIPFVLCAIGLIAAIWALRWPAPAALRRLRWAMGALIAGSLLGGFFHLRTNLELAQEVAAGGPLSTVVWKTLSGAAPLLAPGVLALAGAIAIAATIDHSALRGDSKRSVRS